MGLLQNTQAPGWVGPVQAGYQMPIDGLGFQIPPSVFSAEFPRPERMGVAPTGSLGQMYTRTVVVTANDRSQIRAEEFGADLFLIKPVVIDEMLMLARRLTGTGGTSLA